MFSEVNLNKNLGEDDSKLGIELLAEVLLNHFFRNNASEQLKMPATPLSTKTNHQLQLLQHHLFHPFQSFRPAQFPQLYRLARIYLHYDVVVLVLQYGK